MITDKALKAHREMWNPKQYTDPSHSNYIADPDLRDMTANMAAEVYKLSLAEYRKMVQLYDE